MNIAIDQRATATVVSVDGSLDALTADTLQRAFDTEVRSGRTQLVAGCAGLEYTSSAGLRVLLATMREARHRGGDLRLAGVTDKVRRVLTMSGFTSILKCYPDVESAVASYATAVRA
ncbi:MAG TPA: STAS domain-containing protein [Gemmatimonadaceae bacterium]|nr:STAS domain-containing protein [Gemmatimonadaceae bacterium]